MKKQQSGFSLIESMVSIMVLGIMAFCFVASSVASIAMKKSGLQRSAAARAVNSAMEPLLYQRGNRSELQATLASFPKSITEGDAHKTYQVSIAAVQDHAGATINPAALPPHGVIVVTFSVPYSESVIGVGSGQTKMVTPSYVMEF